MSKGSVIERKGKKGGVSYLLKYDAGKDPETGQRRQRYKTVKGGTRSEADKELRRLLGQVDEGTHVDPSKTTVADWVETWLKDHAAPNVSHKTLERYAELLRLHILPKLGRPPIQRLTTPAIQKVYSNLLASGRRSKKRGADAPAPLGLSARTVLHVHRVLFQCLKAAVRQRIIIRNPATDVTPPNPKRAEADRQEDGAVIKALEKEQLDALLIGLRKRPLFPLAALAAGTGMRRGEMLALRWSDLDLDRKTVRITRAVDHTKANGIRIKNCPKNHASRRTIGIDDGLAALLRSEWKRQAEDALKLGRRLSETALVFAVSPIEPLKPRSPRATTKEFIRLAGNLGFKGLRLHDLRHTHATLLLLANVPVHAVAQRLGHSSPVTTMTVYSHVLRRAEDRAVEVSGDLLKAALAPQG